jgi:hypothetical protein
MKKFLFLLLLINAVVNAQESKDKIQKRIYTTAPLSEEKAPIIDGVLDDAGWNLVEWQTDFIENEPDENTAPTFQTKFKIVYDAKYLYVAIKAFDSEPILIEKRLSRRDGFAGDRVNVLIDSYNDKRTGFMFTITAAGVRGDEIVTDNGDNFDESWNPVWNAKAEINDDGWSAEMKIPLSQLRFGKAKEQIWGLNVIRQIFRKNERSVWNRIPIDAAGFISESGELHGLVDLVPQKQLEIQPFTVLQYDKYPKEGNNPFRDGSDFKLNGGVDAKIGITNDLTLDLTVNPDFGQVEADPAEIALDGFEIFFREQRPFFVENNNIFNFKIGGPTRRNRDNVFFSRRIGRSPQGRVNRATGEFVEQPQNTTILGAAKFSGKTKNGWSIGILESVTSQEYAEIDNNGKRREELVEPLTNYFVGRLQKDFNDKNTFVGGIFTATNRNIEDNLEFLRKSAYTGGLDVKHQWKNRKYYVSGNVILSHVEGSAASIKKTQESLTHLFHRVDASHVKVDPNRTSLTGSSGNLEFGKASVGHWRYDMGTEWRSPELELNDIGFLRQADEIRSYANLKYSTLKPAGKFRSISASLSSSAAFDFEGNYNKTEHRLKGSFEFKNNWGIETGFIHRPRVYSNTTLRGGPRFRYSRKNIHFLFLGTDNRKKFRTTAGYIFSKSKQNHTNFLRFETEFTYQPTNSFSFSFSPEFTLESDKTQFVTNKTYNNNTRYITAELDQKILSASLRLNYIINPNLTIQYYGQPFIARGRYVNFNYITNPVAGDLYDRFDLFDSNQISFDGSNYLIDENTDGTTDYELKNPDFSFVQFRSNLVVRWEYIPGSEIFLVWSQGNVGSQNPKDRLFKSLDQQIFKETPENTFLIKATYRFML